MAKVFIHLSESNKVIFSFSNQRCKNFPTPIIVNRDKMTFTFHGPIENLVKYVSDCLDFEEDYVLQTNFGLFTPKITHSSLTENLKRFITYMNYIKMTN